MVPHPTENLASHTQPGAFKPGLPILPVVVRYKSDWPNLAWPCNGPSVSKLLWCTLCQFYMKVEVEYLPVYTPNEEEKKHAMLYAQNMEKVIDAVFQEVHNFVPISGRELKIIWGYGGYFGACRSGRTIVFKNIFKNLKIMFLFISTRLIHPVDSTG